jgi:lysozyme family protein
MASGNFERALKLVLVHEGGYVNHPEDPGGETNKGVTKAVYDSWRRARRLPIQSVRNITDFEIQGIYRLLYWDRIRGDDLPAGVDYAVFDFSVNSGVGRASHFLQEAVAIASDGIIGGGTLEATARFLPATVINKLCDHRLSFMRGLRIWATFGRGWQARVDGVRKAALAMTGG